MPDTVPKGFVCITSFDQPTKAQRLSPFKLGTQQVKECGEVRTQIHVSPTAGLLLLPPTPKQSISNTDSPLFWAHRTMAALAATSISGRWRLPPAHGLS